MIGTSLICSVAASDLAEMAEEGSTPPQVVARKSQVIQETTKRIANIVKSLLQVSRSGNQDPFRETSLVEIVAEILEICRAKFEDHAVALVLPKTIPEISILCREAQIAQALLNLLDNAFDAVREQEGERWVRLGVERADSSVSLTITNSGPGIPRETRTRMMEPFFTTKPVGKGTGLGLSLSKAIAEDHGGRLEYSEDGGHTRFSLVLPLPRKVQAA